MLDVKKPTTTYLTNKLRRFRCRFTISPFCISFNFKLVQIHIWKQIDGNNDKVICINTRLRQKAPNE